MKEPVPTMLTADHQQCGLRSSSPVGLTATRSPPAWGTSRSRWVDGTGRQGPGAGEPVPLQCQSGGRKRHLQGPRAASTTGPGTDAASAGQAGLRTFGTVCRAVRSLRQGPRGGLAPPQTTSPGSSPQRGCPTRPPPLALRTCSANSSYVRGTTVQSTALCRDSVVTGPPAQNASSRKPFRPPAALCPPRDVRFAQIRLPLPWGSLRCCCRV